MIIIMVTLEGNTIFFYVNFFFFIKNVIFSTFYSGGEYNDNVCSNLKMVKMMIILIISYITMIMILVI